MPHPSSLSRRGDGWGWWWVLSLALLLVAVIASSEPTDWNRGPAEGECWVLYGTGPISSICSTPERLCYRPTNPDLKCWQCVVHAPPVRE
jgi:hypothetical protein